MPPTFENFNQAVGDTQAALKDFQAEVRNRQSTLTPSQIEACVLFVEAQKAGIKAWYHLVTAQQGGQAAAGGR